MVDDHRFGNFDRQYCEKVCKISAATCASFIIAAAVLFVTISPASRCPGWMLTAENGTSSPLYAIAFIPALAAAWLCFLALNWEWAARLIDVNIRTSWEAIASGDRDRFWELPAALLDINVLFTLVCVGWTAFCSIPLLLIFLKCS
jgi:hypothetical protein